MSEYACKECQENCRASANKKPIYCLYSGVDRARWKEVTADQPPKLTAEELDSAKIGVDLAKGKDWTGYHLPDWCKVGAWCYPSWCKVGAWCYHFLDKRYLQIEKIQENVVYFSDHSSRHLYLWQNIFSEARLHPWTDDELKQQVGKPFIFSDGSIVLCLAFADDTGPDSECGLKFADEDGGYYTAKELINANIRQLDNTPCGVLEHRDGEGWVR